MHGQLSSHGVLAWWIALLWQSSSLHAVFTAMAIAGSVLAHCVVMQ